MDGATDGDEGTDDGRGRGGDPTRRRVLRTATLAGIASASGCAGLFEDNSPGATTARNGGEREGANPPGTVSYDPAPETETVTADEDRVEETLASLSLDEKIGQMTQLEPKEGGRPLSVGEARSELADGKVGSMLFGGANAPGTSARDAVEYLNELQAAALDETGVPLLAGIDAVHGNSTVREAAVFPHQIGVGATWNPALAGELAATTARSLVAAGFNWTFSPVADVVVDPRWGRYYECFGEDPFAVGEFVRASVRGYEGVDGGSKRVAATVKHFAGYSMPETGADREPADVSTRTLRDVVLPPFRSGVAAGAETVMANSGSVNGVPAHASRWLGTETLRESWAFDGVLVPDWRDVHRLAEVHGHAADVEEAVELAVTAGLDVYMAPHPAEIEAFWDALASLVETGTITEAHIDESIRRVLRVKDRLGLFEGARVPVENHVGAARDRDRDLARRAAEQSLTLLENDRGVLPLDGDADSVLVAGPLAGDGRRLLGGWTMAWQGAPRERVPETVTLADGVEAAAPSSTDVSVIETRDEVLRDPDEVRSAAADADAVVAALGEGPYAEGAGDLTDLRLPDGQRELVATLSGVEAPTVGVLVAGRPRGSPSLFSDLDAALMACLPGSEGGTAVGNALFGERDPAGRLPITWPRDVGGIPDVVTHRPPPDGASGRSDGPLFPFGHGESYATVSCESISLPGPVESAAEGPGVRASVTLATEDERETEEVVVLLSDHEPREDAPTPAAIPPARQVVGFERVGLDPGESRTVEVPVSLRALGVTDGDVTGDGERVVPAGEYGLHTAAGRVDGADVLRVEETAPLPD